MEENYHPSDFVTWNAGNETLIKRYVSSLMNIITVDDAGNAQTTEITKLDGYIRILIQYLNFPEALKNDWDLKHDLLFMAAFQLKKMLVQDIAQFHLVLAREIKKYLNRPITKFVVIFPLHAICEHLIVYQQLNVLGSILEFRNWESLNDNFEMEVFKKRIKDPRYKVDVDLENIFTPVLMISEGRNEIEAFRKAERKFDIFRVILNIFNVLFMFKRQWGGYPTAYSEYLAPPFYGIFQEDGTFENVFVSISKNLQYKEKKVSKVLFEEACNLVEKLHEPINGDDSMRIFLEAVELYGQSIDSGEWRFSFLWLWQILELLTLKSIDKIREVDVITRLSGALSLDQYHEDLLQVMYSSRNSLVHENKFPIGNEQAMMEFEFLKKIVDIMINNSLGIVLKYPTIYQLSSYYRNFSPQRRKKS